MPPRKKAAAKKNETKAAPEAEAKVAISAQSSGANKAAPGGKPTAQRVDELKEKGNKAFNNKDFARALEYFTRALEIDEKQYAVMSNRSATYAAMKNFTKALEDAEGVIKIKPDWPKGYLRKGQALEGLLQYQEAFEAYKQGLALDSNDQLLKKAADDMAQLIDELRLNAAAATQSSKDNPDGDKFDAMIKWLKDGGAQFPKLYLQYYGEDWRGVHALCRIPNDEIILYVPLKYIMTSEVAKASEIGKKIIASGIELRSTHSYLASYLLQEKHKGKKSFWEPYIRILPEKYANMPIFFSDKMLATWLTGSMTLQKIADRIDSLRREYEALRRAIPEFGKFTLWEFMWARIAVITRIFGLVIEGNKTDGLVPYADMLNHKKPSELGGGKDTCETKWTYDDSRGGFIIQTLRPIQRGDQVFDSYGRKCNSRFFVNYGFALDDNHEDNEAVIRVQLPPNDPHYHLKVRMLGGREISARREYQIPAWYREKKTRELFGFMRFVHARDSELLPFTSASNGSELKLDEVEPISIRNEIKVLEDIREACKESYAKFPEPIEYDEELLASGKLKMYSNERNCVVMRHGEKKVLVSLIKLADEAIPLLKKPWQEVKRIAAKAAHGNSNLDYYITHVVAPLLKKGQ